MSDNANSSKSQSSILLPLKNNLEKIALVGGIATVIYAIINPEKGSDLMLILFFVSWPISLGKLLSSGKNSGKSFVQLINVLFFYIYILGHKMIGDYSSTLTIINTVVVFLNILAYMNNRKIAKENIIQPNEIRNFILYLLGFVTLLILITQNIIGTYWLEFFGFWYLAVGWIKSNKVLKNAKSVAGETPIFILTVLFGYLCVISFRLQVEFNWILLAVYTFNLLLVIRSLYFFMKVRQNLKETLLQ